MGVNAWLEMKKHVPDAEFTLLPTLMHELTYIKTPEEIRAMAKAGELAMNALFAVAARAKPGVREYQLAAAATHAVMDGGGRVHLLDAPHLTVFPGLFLAVVVLGFNFLGAGLRDALDPRRR